MRKCCTFAVKRHKEVGRVTKLTERLGPAEPGGRVGRHVFHGHLEVPAALAHAVGGAHHGVALLARHRQTVVGDLQLGCWVQAEYMYKKNQTPNR